MKYILITKLKKCFFLSFLILTQLCVNAQNDIRKIEELNNNWLFINQDIADGAKNNLDEKNWQTVTVPHDWAINQPFNRNNDIQIVKVGEDGETKASERTGRTGGLPYQGVGWYRKHLKINSADKGKDFSIEFDGAMSHAKVYLNDKFVGTWPYGYSSFHFDITKYLNWGGDNVLAVRLENQEESSRWYPGAGIYRNVRLVITNPTHVSTWGTFITTPQVSAQKALVNVQTQISQSYRIAKDLKIATTLFTSSNQKIITKTAINFINDSTINQVFEVLNPKLWSANQPQLYYAITSIIKDGNIIDNYKTIFGIRKIEFKPNEGMLVNGINTKIKGVCLHHDLGALGTAINKSALRYRLQLLKDMGCNAIRGTHNPHAPEMLALCDEMGFYFIDEAFDEWKYPKVKNGYHLLFDEWAKKDIEAMVFRDRNHPALIMYSIGNEIKEQNKPDGSQIAKFLRDICHQADSTRPVTAGFDNWNAAIKNGLADAVDIPGWNYKPQLYKELHQKYPNWVIYGSETASTVSSRGAYPLPAVQASMKIWPDNQSSSFDLERCSWSQIPDTEWKSQDSNDFVAGEFVWTGVDYLGEPTPYSANWPSRSSYFGIIDLSGLPKDRYYLYQSHWSDKKMLHILPHWNWVGKEGQNIPVYAYTNYPSAELFINGKSFGKKTFNKANLLDTYRLRWDNAIYQPGEIKVVAYDENGAIAETKSIKTAGKPANIVLQSHSNALQPNGKDLAFVTVTVVDKDGNLCPLADNLINFKVTGAGFLRAVDNGNPASLEPFQVNYRKAFFGKCMAMVQNNNQKGKITIEASAKNLKTQYLTIQAK